MFIFINARREGMVRKENRSNFLEYQFFFLLDLNFTLYIQLIYKIGLSCCVEETEKVFSKWKRTLKTLERWLFTNVSIGSHGKHSCYNVPGSYILCSFHSIYMFKVLVGLPWNNGWSKLRRTFFIHPYCFCWIIILTIFSLDLSLGY